MQRKFTKILAAICFVPGFALAGQGMLMSINPKGEPAGPCPLKHTDVKAEISGFLSRVTVTQEFEIPFHE